MCVRPCSAGGRSQDCSINLSRAGPVATAVAGDLGRVGAVAEKAVAVGRAARRPRRPRRRSMPRSLKKPSPLFDFDFDLRRSPQRRKVFESATAAAREPGVVAWLVKEEKRLQYLLEAAPQTWSSFVKVARQRRTLAHPRDAPAATHSRASVARASLCRRVCRLTREDAPWPINFSTRRSPPGAHDAASLGCGWRPLQSPPPAPQSRASGQICEHA